VHIHTASSEAAGIHFSNTTTGTGASNGSFVGIGSGEQLYMWQRESNSLLFGTDNTEAMRITSSGNLLFGQSSTVGPGNGNTTTGGGWESSGRLWASTASSDHGFNRNSNGVNISIRNSGTQIGYIFNNATSVTYNTTSDQRLKENIADADDAGSKIDAIQVRKFDWIADGSHQDYGMVAQELITVAPEAVSAPEDPEDMMGVDYSKLVPMLIKEIQSLRNRVAQLENN
jgi:predicted 3-demethylubiquinone-9 3-methyltransferase (glyoxalase superfamily)